MHALGTGSSARSLRISRLPRTPPPTAAAIPATTVAALTRSSSGSSCPGCVRAISQVGNGHRQTQRSLPHCVHHPHVHVRVYVCVTLAAELLLAQCKYIYGDTLPDTTEAVASFNSRFGGGTFPFESQPTIPFVRKEDQPGIRFAKTR